MANEHRQSPEDAELAVRRSELQTLEEALVQGELSLATDEVELRDFEQLYLRQVGPVIAQLDQLEAQLASLRAKEEPSDFELSEKAAVAAARAQASAEAAAATMGESESRNPRARSEDVKRIYRDAARRLHPDLAQTDEQRGARHDFMSRVNRAYEAGDSEEIQRILDEWEFAPEAVPEGDTGSRLVRTIRSIAQVRRRLEEIARRVRSLHASEAWLLKESWEVARVEGRDLLAHMVERASGRIAELQHQIGKHSSGPRV